MIADAPMSDTLDAEPISAEDRAALRESIRDVLQRHSDSASVRAAITAPNRFDASLWSTLCAEIGVAALAIPESHGGAGASFAETAVVLEELGAALAPVPVYSSAVLATAAILIAGDDDASARLLPDLASGDRIGTLAWANSSGWCHAGVHAEAGLLTGSASFVTDGDAADTLLVLAAGPGGVTLHEIESGADGVHVVALPTMDPTRPMARIDFDGAVSRPIPTPDDFTTRLRTCAWALLSAEQVGGASATLTATVDYTNSRKQFGRALGSFQALKHRMADMYTRVEAARSISAAAVDAVVAGSADAERLAASAHVFCSEAFTSVAGDAIQLHGGIGITWEHDIQLYFKRAQSSSQLFGQPHEVVADLARTFG